MMEPTFHHGRSRETIMLEPPVTPIRKANDGLELPATGFGTYKVNGLAGVDAI